MQGSFNRRVATRIKNGRVQRKNRHTPTAHQGYFIDRESPGRGCRHVVTKADILAFIEIIPDWPRISHRLERIVLCRRSEWADGLYEFFHREETGGIFLCAWDEELWHELSFAYFEGHKSIFERLGVNHEETKTGVLCRFTESQARAFMLLHVFLHELGHHFDKLHQKHRHASRGEEYAERFAASRFDSLFPAYVQRFGHPSRTEN